MTIHRSATFAAVLSVLALTGAACGDDDDAPAEQPQAPATTEDTMMSEDAMTSEDTMTSHDTMTSEDTMMDHDTMTSEDTMTSGTAP
jgi:hypothetical protein